MKSKLWLSVSILVVLIIVGSVSGIYALNLTQYDNSGMGISKTNNNGIVHGSKTIYVAKNGTDRNDGLTLAKPKRNIANAIRSANPGDTIKIAPGTYTENLIIDKSITLIGNNQKNTILDGQNKENCIIIKSGFVVVITNFTIKNGTYNSKNFGGGICNGNSTLTVTNTTITNNTAEDGGGIYSYGPITLKKVTITNNKANANGGGIETSSSMVMEDSTIANNTAEGGGGGIDNPCSTITLHRVNIQNNTARNTGGGIDSGGVLTIEDSTITDNVAGNTGGGISNYNLMYVYGSTITNNRARDGGGIYNSRTAYIDDFSKIVNNILNDFGGNPFIPA